MASQPAVSKVHRDIADAARRHENPAFEGLRGADVGPIGNEFSPLASFFGRSASDVRVHRDPPGVGPTQTFGAEAVALGPSIHLASDAPSLSSPDGRQLLAHEMGHALNAAGDGPGGSFRASTPNDPSERWAAAASLAYVRGAPAAPPAPAHQAGVAYREVADPVRLIADENAAGIVRFTQDPQNLNATTPAQRASMISVIVGLWGTFESQERAALTLLEHDGEAQIVIGYLELLGVVEPLKRTVGNEELAARLDALLAMRTSDPDAAHDPVAQAAIDSGDVEQVIAIVDFTRASDRQRIGLLKLALSGYWVGEDQEWKVVEILNTARDLPRLMNELRDLGMVETLFYRVDNEGPKMSLVVLLGSLGDPQINADLEVYQSSGLWNFLRTIGGGASLAWQSFSKDGILHGAWNLFRGILHPIVAPIETLTTLFGQAVEILQTFDVTSLEWWDRVVTFLRDTLGAVAVWALAGAAACGAIALGSAFLAGLFAETGVGFLIFGAIAMYFAIAMEYLGILAGWAGLGFLLAALARAVIDLVQGSSASSARSLSREQGDVAEDATIAAVVGALKVSAKGFQLGKAALEQSRGYVESSRAPSSEPVEPTSNAHLPREATASLQEIRGAAETARQTAPPGTELPAPEPPTQPNPQPDPSTLPQPTVMETLVGPDLQSARVLGQQQRARVVAAEGSAPPEPRVRTEFEAEGHQFENRNAPPNVAPESVDRAFVRFPLSRDSVASAAPISRIGEVTAIVGELGTEAPPVRVAEVLAQRNQTYLERLWRDAMDRAGDNARMREVLEAYEQEVFADIETVQAVGEYMLGRVKPGGTLEVVFYESRIGGELAALERMTHPSADGTTYTWKVGPTETVPRSDYPHSGYLVPPTETVSRALLTKVPVSEGSP